MATIGAQLTDPEYGWQRIDDNSSSLSFIGSWSRRSDGSSYGTYNNTWIESYTVGDYIKFTMFSSRLRIIAYGNTDTSGFEVFIDGVSKGTFRTTYGITRCVLACDIGGLTFTTHNVEIVLRDKSLFSSSSTTRLLFDTIDIDSHEYIISNHNYINFQHYAIRMYNKHYILTKKYFDLTKMEFTPVTLVDLYNFDSEISDKQLDVTKIFNPINVAGKIIYPLDCFKSTSGMRIMKIVGSSFTYPAIYNNNKITSITLKANFINLYNSTLIKLKDVIKLKFDELKYFVATNNSSTLKVGIESNSILYGKNFKIITEDEIISKGFDTQDLNKLEVPFDNVRFIFAFKDICTNSNDELKYIKITKSNDYLKRPLLVNKDYMAVIDKRTNNLYIKLLRSFPSIIIDRIENINKISKTTNTLDTF